MTTREELLSDTFLTLADTLVDDFDLIEVFTALAERSVQLLDADAAGILIADQRGAMQVIATSSEKARLLELFQVQADEGPCLDAHRLGRVVSHLDLDHDSPWPRFGPRALEAGFRSVHAVPMRQRTERVGAFNLFMETPKTLEGADVLAAQALAHAATIALLQDHAAREAQVLTTQLQHALDSRVVIEQAKGVLAERSGVDMDEAFVVLRNHARDHNERLGDVVRAVVDNTLSAGVMQRLLRASEERAAPDKSTSS